VISDRDDRGYSCQNLVSRWSWTTFIIFAEDPKNITAQVSRLRIAKLGDFRTDNCLKNTPSSSFPSLMQGVQGNPISRDLVARVVLHIQILKTTVCAVKLTADSCSLYKGRRERKTRRMSHLLMADRCSRRLAVCSTIYGSIHGSPRGSASFQVSQCNLGNFGTAFPVISLQERIYPKVSVLRCSEPTASCVVRDDGSPQWHIADHPFLQLFNGQKPRQAMAMPIPLR